MKKIHSVGPSGRDCAKKNGSWNFSKDSKKVNCNDCLKEENEKFWICADCGKKLSIMIDNCPSCILNKSVVVAVGKKKSLKERLKAWEEKLVKERHIQVTTTHIATNEKEIQVFISDLREAIKFIEKVDALIEEVEQMETYEKMKNLSEFGDADLPGEEISPENIVPQCVEKSKCFKIGVIKTH